MHLISKSIIFLTLMTISFSTIAQKNTVDLSQNFKDYEIVNFKSASLKSNLMSQRSDEKKLTLKNWEMTLFDSKIISNNYRLTTAIPDFTKRDLPLAMNGYTREGGRVSITINDNFIYGFIESNGSTYYIEPVSHFKKGDFNDQYVIYDLKNIIDGKEHTCGITSENKVSHKHRDFHNESERQVGECFEIDYSIANDWSMFQSYGSVTSVENHAVGVTNNVQTNYDDEFADELQFVIVEQFVSNCSTCDPWTTSTNAQTFLQSFTNWAPNGFSSGHDLGSIWTGRDFDGSTIGIAWVGVICSTLNYNALEDFSSNASLKRVMVAHEIGHNFDANHDGTGSSFIMAPSVNNTNTWSAASISSIQAHYNTSPCLSNCTTGGNVPVANFTYNINQNCTPGIVQYTNSSTGNITQWNWVFDGGSPATSTQQNPVVTYFNPGVYDVQLTVTAGSQTNQLVLQNEIEILPSPEAEFTYSVTGSFVDFTNTFNGGSSATYLWNFGDNSTSSQENPSHNYTADGTYTVTLTIDNDCGTSSTTNTVVIQTPPSANFTSNAVNGCNTFVVNYTNTSTTNTTSQLWVFQGGNPATSTAANPVVSYSTPGSYQVSLTASNAQGSNNKTLLNYITVYPSPVASFTYSQAGAVFGFVSTSTNSTTYLYDFGDGSTSTLQNPTHTYANGGTYTVSLTTTNALCQPNTITQTINATSAPISSFTSSGNSGCNPFTTTFTSTSLNTPSSFTWTFPGGSPASSTLSNPTVTYNAAGSYDVILTTTNSFGSNTLNLPNYIQILTTPTPNFTYSQTGLNYLFNNTSSGSLSYLWDFGDGTTSTLENPNHTFASQGTYNVKLTTTNACGSDNKTIAVVVLLAPNASFAASSGQICSGETIDYVDNSTGTVVSRAWTFEGGNPSVSNLPNPSVSYATSGSYLTRLIVTNSAGSDTMEFLQNVTIGQLPNAQFSVIENLTTIDLTNTSSAANSIQWTLPNGTTSTQNNVQFTPTENGNYTFTLIAVNECGTNTISELVNFNNIPEATLSTNLEDLGNCAPISVQYEAKKINNSTYAWSFEGGNPLTATTTNPIVTYNTAGSHNVQLIVTNSLGADTSIIEDYVVLSATPEVNFIEKVSLGNVSFEYTGTEASSYLWDFAGQGSSVEKNPTFNFNASGTYLVKCVATNECGMDTFQKSLTIIITNTEDQSFIQNFKIYPNPVSNFITIEMKNTLSETDLEIIDNVGRKIVSQKLIQKSNNVELENIPQGLYTIILKNGDKSAVYRFSKQ
jgi:PKD repeat protein